MNIISKICGDVSDFVRNRLLRRELKDRSNIIARRIQAVIARREAPRQSSAHRTGEWIASPGLRRTRNDREKCGFPRNDGVMRGVLCDIKRKACFNVIARREAPRQSMRSIKKYAVPALCLLFAACDLQGPWSYWPEDEKQYRGVYTLAYVIADRPVNRMCFQRLLSLNEAASDNFAFYDSATVKISGNFSGRDTTLSLAPESAYPNCFDGPADLLAERGKNYSLDAYFVWDSSGKSVRSHYTAEATVPSVFAISSAFAPDMHGKYHEIHDGDTAYSLSYPNDLLTYKFHPEYDDSVHGVFYSIHYDNVSGGENTNNFLNSMLSDFIDDPILMQSPFDTVATGGFSLNYSFDGLKSIDTIEVIGAQLPVSDVKLLFYATDQNYADFETKTLESATDSRVKAVTNVKGGAGFFSGMTVDTMRLYRGYTETDKITYYPAQGIKTCRDTSWSTKACRAYLYTFCADSGYTARECYAPAVRVALESGKTWDALLPDTLDSAARSLARLDGEKRYCIANNFPTADSYCAQNYADCQKSKEENTCKDVLWNYCADENWNLTSKPQCGTALVSRYRLQKLNSSILRNAVANWCAANKSDPQCGY